MKLPTKWIAAASGLLTLPVAGSQSVSTAEDTAKAVTLTASDFNVNNVIRYVFDTPNQGLAGVPANLQHDQGYANVPNTSGTDHDTQTRNFVQLDPHVMPAHVFRVRRHARNEHDFEYFI